VEDDREMQSAFAAAFGEEGVEVLQAFNTDDAKQLFDGYRDEIGAILLDGVLPGELNIIVLTHHVRLHFNGTIIAISSVEEMRAEMISIGCTHGVRWKQDAIPLVLSVFRK
jgi:DNA-binding response OmpR family regulator